MLFPAPTCSTLSTPCSTAARSSAQIQISPLILGGLTGEVLQTSISVVISSTTATGILPRKGAALQSGPERILCKRTGPTKVQGHVQDSTTGADDISRSQSRTMQRLDEFSAGNTSPWTFSVGFCPKRVDSQLPKPKTPPPNP